MFEDYKLTFSSTCNTCFNPSAWSDEHRSS